MKVFKRYSFVSPLTGERVWCPSYMVANVEDMDAVSKVIVTDVSENGREFEVDAGEKGRTVFKTKGNLYKTWIEYTWR